MSDQVLNFADLMQALFHHFRFVVLINAALINDYRLTVDAASNFGLLTLSSHPVLASSLAVFLLEIFLNQNLPDTEGKEDPNNHQDYLRIPTGRQILTPWFASAAYSRVELVNLQLLQKFRSSHAPIKPASESSSYLHCNSISIGFGYFNFRSTSVDSFVY